LLPVLNESDRIERCLDGLITQTDEVTELLVVDGGSTDGTQSIVERYTTRDGRVRLVDASPVSKGWTGKAWGLHVGFRNTSPNSDWVLCVDADVRVSPMLGRSLLAHARRTGVSTFSVATRQRLSGNLDGLLHPSLLTTLVYRYGSPGSATRKPRQVQANGQCFFSRRDILLRTDAFRSAQASLCEDITSARRIASCGQAVGFYESDNLIEVTMYSSWQEIWSNWPRSLPMRDQYFGASEALGLAEVLLVQALPLPVLLVVSVLGATPWILAVNGALTLTRLGVLMGFSRAYIDRPRTYWLSPACDFAVAFRLIESALRRRQTWRGRTYARRKDGGFQLFEGAE
jgi:dolichol-phosphate mannosyltransferase